MAGASDEVDLHGRGARVRPERPLGEFDTKRCDVGDRESHGPRAEEREIHGKGARGLGEIDEERSLPEAGGYPTDDGAGRNPNAGEYLETGTPQGTGVVGCRAGVEEQGRGAGLLRLTCNEHARAAERAVQVGHAKRVLLKARVETAWRDEPRPFVPGRVARAAALLLASTLRKYPGRLVANSSHDDLNLGTWLAGRVVEAWLAVRAVGARPEATPGVPSGQRPA